MSGQQAIGSFSGDPFATNTAAWLTALPAANRLLINGTFVKQPVPTTWADAMLDTTVVANGDLSTAINLDSIKVQPGKLLNFHFVATYTGDNPITGVTLRGYIPWGSGTTGVNCTTQGASNCIVDNASGNIHVSFDIQPGGLVDISGQIVVLESPDSPAPFTAVVYGPAGLSEQDTINNFARTSIMQCLFCDGFE